VSPTQSNNATVNIETAIKADQKKFMQQTGLQPGQAQSPIGVDAETMMSPAAGILKVSFM
jgi:cysteine desulfurase